MKMIHTNNAPKAVGPYSQAVMAGNTLYVSGQLPLNPETMTMPTTVAEQTKQSLSNILAIVKESGLKIDNIVKCGVFLQDMGTFKEMNEVYAAFFRDHKPARFAIEVAKLPLGALIEIDAIVVKD